jgi:hypothetical protein
MLPAQEKVLLGQALGMRKTQKQDDLWLDALVSPTDGFPSHQTQGHPLAPRKHEQPSRIPRVVAVSVGEW